MSLSNNQLTSSSVNAQALTAKTTLYSNQNLCATAFRFTISGY